MVLEGINEIVLFPFLSEQYKIEDCVLKSCTSEKSYINKNERLIPCYEMHFIEKGTIRCNINNEEIVVNKGEYLFISPNTYHKYTDISDDCVMYSLTYNLTGKIYKENKDSGFIKGEITECAHNLLEQAIDCINNKHSEFDINLGGKIYCLICEFVSVKSDFLDESDETYYEDTRLDKAKRYIDYNARYGVSCDDVAKHCCISTKQLSRIFMKYENMTLGGYITQARYKKIEHLITDTEMSLHQISDYMSFCDEYYFNKFFKKHSGIAPGEYRRILKQK